MYIKEYENFHTIHTVNTIFYRNFKQKQSDSKI